LLPDFFVHFSAFYLNKSMNGFLKVDPNLSLSVDHQSIFVMAATVIGVSPHAVLLAFQ
jgi:hypothetical protein